MTCLAEDGESNQLRFLKAGAISIYKRGQPIYSKGIEANSVSSLDSLLNPFIINHAVQWRTIPLDDQWLTEAPRESCPLVCLATIDAIIGEVRYQSKRRKLNRVSSHHKEEIAWC